MSFVSVGISYFLATTVLLSSTTGLSQTPGNDNVHNTDDFNNQKHLLNVIPMAIEHVVEEHNKKSILDFYNEIFTNKNIPLAANKYISPTNYIEHNPHQLDGIDGFKTTMQQLVDASPGQTMDIKRIIAKGNMVWVHGKTSWLGTDVAFVDIYKIEHGKIVEHWDVIQPIPTNSSNPHPMF